MVKTSFLIIYNVVRIALNKIIRPHFFCVHLIQRISPLCALKIFGHGVLKIGRNCEFAAYCNFETHNNGRLEIGEGCYFNRFCMISVHNNVTIGKKCMFGPGVKIFDNNHQHNPKTGVSSELTIAPIIIGDNSWICSDVIILKGAKIGKNCVIGAGCIIYGEVPDGSVVKCEQKLVLR